VGTEDLVGRLQGMVDELNVKADRATAVNERFVATVRSSLYGILAMRSLPCPDAVRARIDACDDPDTFQRWLSRAFTARSAEEVVADDAPRR
jgi:hypothetical protein